MATLLRDKSMTDSMNTFLKNDLIAITDKLKFKFSINIILYNTTSLVE